MTHKEISNQTRTELASALRCKMELKPFKTISVRELTRDCCLDRHTFYYHFRDIYGLMEWMFQQDKRRMMEQLKELRNWSDCLAVLLNYLRENRASCLCAMNSIHGEYFDQMLFDVVQTAQMRIGAEGDMTRFYTCVYISVFKSYLREELGLSDDDLLKHLDRMQQQINSRSDEDN